MAILSIDYYAFTVNVQPEDFEGTDFYGQHVFNALSNTIPLELIDILFAGEYTSHQAKPPFGQMFRFNETGVTIIWGGGFKGVLVQISGQACYGFHSQNTLMYIIRSTYEKCSRIDIALDIHTDITPREFTDVRGKSRYKVNEAYDKATGKSDYLGSRESECMARVYRYNEPHQRAHLLRVEIECKKKLAKSTACAVTENDLETIFSSLSKRFAFEHNLLSDLKPTELEIKSYRPKRDNEDKYAWYLRQVIPSMRRIIDEGHADELLEFLNTYLFPNYKQKIEKPKLDEYTELEYDRFMSAIDAGLKRKRGYIADHETMRD